MKKQYIIPIFVPHLGCPNNCIFCNQKTISGQLKMVTPKEVKETIEYFLKNVKDASAYKEVAFFGGSFTAIDSKQQEELLQTAYEYIKSGKVDSIRISTRPDCINKEILKRLKKYKVKTIELGVQSSNNYILKRIERGHTFEDVKKASKLIRWHGFTLGHQMMIGLPESTKQDEIDAALALIKLRPKMMRIYPVLVIKGTSLAKEYAEGKYEPLPLPQAVERCKELVIMFQKKKIDVIRIGLQNTDTIAEPGSDKSEVLAGPYHPAFRQLVEASMWYDSIAEKIKKFNVKVKKVEILANEEDINNIVGHKRENITKLADTYDVETMVKKAEHIKPGKFEISILDTYPS